MVERTQWHCLHLETPDMQQINLEKANLQTEMKKAVMLKRMKMPRRRGTGKISHKRTTQGNFIALENQKIGSQSKQEKGYDNFPDHRNNACPICYITRGRQALFYSNYFFLIESCNIYCRFSLSLYFFLFCQTYNI